MSGAEPQHERRSGGVDAAHHSDNQRRLMALESKVDENTKVTEQLAADTAELVGMWRDAGVVFKWLRKIGALLMWVSKLVAAVGVVYGLGKYFGGGSK